MANITLYLIPGMKVKLSAPIDPINSMGHFANMGEIKLNGATRQTLNGYVVENEVVGIIDTEGIESEPAVNYIHKKPEKNTIYFYATTGEIGTVTIDSVPIHDHSSVVQGGPAYGTYFSDDESVTTTDT